MTAEYDLSIHQNPDATAWAKLFCDTFPNCGIGEDVMIGWFANAMMAMHDFLQGGGPINGDHAQWMIDREAPE